MVLFSVAMAVAWPGFGALVGGAAALIWGLLIIGPLLQE